LNKIVPIFSGGGTRLMAHVGILQALDELDIEFDQIVGISGGSIVSSLFCAGLGIAEIKVLAMETDFRQFRGFSLYRLLKDGGLSSGNKFENWMDKQLQGITFAELTKDLSILATDVNGGGPVIFNKTTTPNLKVSQAVRYSMSIPLFFTFKPYKDHVLVDGAILSEDALFQDWSGEGVPTMCFRLKSQQVTLLRKRPSMFNLPDYIFMLIRTFMTAISREYIHAEHWHNTIVIETGTISSVDFNMSEEEKEFLFMKGFETALKFIPIKTSLHK
jgi:NTE family protein